MSNVTSTNVRAGRALGIDIGGSGMKAAVVDLASGELVTDRYRIDTPKPATPEAMAEVVVELVRYHRWEGTVGCAFPAIVRNGVVGSAANIDESWLHVDADEVFSSALGVGVHMINDADAAGLAEVHYGVAVGHPGVLLMLTFGTGIGSAVIHNGVLLPNTEFGHIEVGGKEAEHRAASSVKERKEWSYERWTKEVSKVLVAVENAIWPDLIIVGGGISRKAEKWVPLLENRTPVVAAELQNTAGIVGAAMSAASG